MMRDQETLPERVRQRRALYTVLQRWLDESNLMKAMQILEEQFQNQPSLAMNDYLNRIAPLYRERVDAKTLRRELMQLLVRRNAELAPDPLPLLQRHRAQTDTNPLDREPSPTQLAMHRLVSEIMLKLTPTQHNQLYAALALQLKKHFVNGSYDALARYLLSDNPLYLSSFSDQTLRTFFNLVYVAACEVLGPVTADRWFGDSIEHLRKTDQAAGDAVNRFL